MIENSSSMCEEKNVVDLTMSKNGGVLKEIIQPGSSAETPCDGCKVFVHYTGKLLDGTKFDSSRDRAEKFSFGLGQGEVIKAWDLGVASMKKGEISKLTCKPEFAYGEQGSPPTIPPNATLIFEIELFDWELEDITEDHDKGITRQIVVKGSQYDMPNQGSIVEVNIKGIYDGTEFDNRALKFNLGEDDIENLPKSVEIAILKMKKGEESTFYMKSNYAFGAEGNESLGVPGNADVRYEIHLQSFEKVREAWEMSDDEKVEQSEIIKNKGTEYFKAGKLKKAISQYKRITVYLDYKEGKDTSELPEKWISLKLASHLNLALCYIKTKEYELATTNCDEAIKIDKQSEKAYFRRGEAELARNNYEDAKLGFVQAKNLNPGNKLTHKKISECNIQISKQKEKVKKTFAGMFDKFAREDEKEEIRRRQMAKAKKTKTTKEPTDATSEAGGDINQETKEITVNGD